MPPKSINAFHRQNLLQIKEQELLNKEMKKELSAQKERADKRVERLKSQYTSKPKIGSQMTNAKNSGANNPQQQQQQQQKQQRQRQPQQQQQTQYQDDQSGEKIEVFVRETDPQNRQHYVIFEGEAETKQPNSSQSKDNDVAANVPPSQPACRRSAADAVRSGSGTGSATNVYHNGVPCPTAEPSENIKCGKASGTAGAARRKGIENTKPLQRPGSSGSSTVGHKAGHIPAYLKQRKQELLDEKALLAKQAEETRIRSKYPAGQVPLSQEEKEEILKGLEAKKGELLLELNKLPMRFDTTAIQNRRRDIEAQLRDVEHRVGVFSRRQVFVPETAVA